MQSVGFEAGQGRERRRTQDRIDKPAYPGYGSSGAGSMPIALTEALDAGRIKRGDRLMLAAFGAGMVWVTALIEWGAGEPTEWRS